MNTVNTCDIRMKGSNITDINRLNKKITDVLNILKDSDMSVLDFKFSVTFTNDASQIEPDKESFTTDRIDFDVITEFKYLPDDNRSELIRFLQDNSYKIINTSDGKNKRSPISEFIDKFMEKYNACDHLIKYTPDPEKCDISKSPLDINQYFIFNNIPYRLREVALNSYQLTPEHIIAY